MGLQSHIYDTSPDG